MDAPAKPRAKPQRTLPSSDMTYFEDRGSVYDAPIEVLWDFIEKDEEFHPRAHSNSLRNLEAKELSEVSTLISCEVLEGGRWRKMVVRITTIRPAVRITEELEGWFQGSKKVFLYRPGGSKTAVDVLCYMRSSEFSPEEVKRITLKTHAAAFAEDVPFLRRFVRKRPVGPSPRS